MQHARSVYGEGWIKPLSKRNLIVMQYLQSFLEALLAEDGAEFEDEFES